MPLTEHQEALRLVSWLDWNGIAYAAIGNVTTSKRNGAKQKAAGLQKGFPDYVILPPDGGAMFFELKRHGAKPRPEQYTWLDTLTDLGYPATWGTAEQGIAWLREHGLGL